MPFACSRACESEPELLNVSHGISGFWAIHRYKNYHDVSQRWQVPHLWPRGTRRRTGTSSSTTARPRGRLARSRAGRTAPRASSTKFPAHRRSHGGLEGMGAGLLVRYCRGHLAQTAFKTGKLLSTILCIHRASRPMQDARLRHKKSLEASSWRCPKACVKTCFLPIV